MHSALDIARHIVWTGHTPDDPGDGFYISPLRLQKMLYFCQGWSMALLGRPLFNEAIEAWPMGPVVRRVYDQFRGKSDCINPTDFGRPVEELTLPERRLIDSVVERYAAIPTPALIDMTHREKPWLEARKGLAAADKCDTPMSNELIRKTYEALAEKKGDASLVTLQEEWRDDSLAETGEPADAVFAELLSQCN